MYTQADIKAATEANKERQAVISDNRSRRLRGYSQISVPEKVTLYGHEVYLDGDYKFFISSDDLVEVWEKIKEYQEDSLLDGGTVSIKRVKLHGVG